MKDHPVNNHNLRNNPRACVTTTTTTISKNMLNNKPKDYNSSPLMTNTAIKSTHRWPQPKITIQLPSDIPIPPINATTKAFNSRWNKSDQCPIVQSKPFPRRHLLSTNLSTVQKKFCIRTYWNFKWPKVCLPLVNSLILGKLWAIPWKLRKP